MEYQIRDISTSSELKAELIEFAKACSFQGTGTYLAELLSYNELEADEKVFAAVSEDRLIGFAALMECSCVENDDRTPWLDFLFVDEHFRGQHIGSALIDAVCRYAKQIGYSEIFLCTVSHSEYYKKLGFVIRDMLMYYNDEQLDRAMYIMQRSVSDL